MVRTVTPASRRPNATPSAAPATPSSRASARNSPSTAPRPAPKDGPGGWNAPGPQPGGIPLRPLALGDILSGAFTSVRRNPAATIGLAAIVLACYGVLSTVLSLIERNGIRNLRLTV